jgi:hypothetical protein
MGRRSQIAEVHVLSPPAPLEVKLNIALEVAFNSSQPGMRHAGGLPLHFPRIKAVKCDKNGIPWIPFRTPLVSTSAAYEFIR